MIALALLLTLVAPAGATDFTLVCTQTVEGGREAKQFRFGFSADDSSVSKVTVDDPQNVFDPLGKIVVYEYGGSGMSKSLPPKSKLNFSGKREAEGFTFNSKDKVLSITLSLVPGKDGALAYHFTGTRRMDSTMFADLEGAGTCKAAGAATL